MLEFMITLFDATIGRNDTWPLAMVIAGIMAVSFWFSLQILKHEEAIDYALAVCWHVMKIIGWHIGYTAVTIIRGSVKLVKALGKVTEDLTQYRQSEEGNYLADN